MVYLLCDIEPVHVVFPEKVISMQSQSSNFYRITQANFEITQAIEITQGIFQKTQGICQKTQGNFPKTPKTGKCICRYRPEKRAKKSAWLQAHITQVTTTYAS